jgi:hypothetical protein
MMKHSTDKNREETDALLRAYFRSEMPSPWPTLSRTRPASPPVSWASAAASRWALAASIAVLLAAGYFVSSLAGPNAPTFNVGGGVATHPRPGEVPMPMNK